MYTVVWSEKKRTYAGAAQDCGAPATAVLGRDPGALSSEFPWPNVLANL